MDYLDLKKEFRHHVMLMIGYVLIAVAIVTAALILLYQAYGFGIGKNGTVIQNGLTFFSSHPRGANIYVNESQEDIKTTNTRLTLPANVYKIRLARDGYRDWQRTINIDGGSVQHFDYPFLFPKKLTTTTTATLPAAPHLATQSPNQRWLLVFQSEESQNEFSVYDLENPEKPAETLSFPTTLLTKANSDESLMLEEWADDNQHVVLQHNYDGKTEFLLIDRTEPAKSINLSTTLATTVPKLTLNDKKYNQYYLYDPATSVLQTASLKAPALVTRLENVLAYKSYGDDTVLYTTTDKAPAGKVFVKFISGTTSHTIRTLPIDNLYLLDLTKYDGKMYVVVAASGEGKVYIYRDPVGQIESQLSRVAVPTQVLRLLQPNYLSFSNNAQFIVVENGLQFGVYDIENKLPYSYTASAPLDVPQTHASWMDGNRLTYVSNGKLVVTDYDNRNHQTLMTASSSYLPFFAPDYNSVSTIVPVDAAGQYSLTRTALLTPADQ